MTDDLTKASSEEKRSALGDAIYILGLILVAFSTILFGLSMTDNKAGNYEGVILFCFSISVIYWLTVILSAVFFRRSYHSSRIYPGLVLSLLSCYALNRSIEVFAESTTWFSITLVIVSVGYLALPLFHLLNKYIQYLTAFVVGVGFVVFVYLSICLASSYGYGILFILALGLSLHVYVPLAFVVVTLVAVFRKFYFNKIFIKAFIVGLVCSILLVIGFTIQWSGTVASINSVFEETRIIKDQTYIPVWIRVAQRLPKDGITSKVLKVDLKYKHSTLMDFGSDVSFESGKFYEKQVHDPLVTIACLLCGKSYLNTDEKVKIMGCLYDSRHQAIERLWGDDGIETEKLNTSVLIWPQYRMAYTEQLVKLRNNNSGWRAPGEAIYTYHLPEGSVVSSLSLWVNEEERKGILTSVEKADSAYRQIVGVEARDPSVVHWQEGSKVTVRVFPVSSGRTRIFKIGISSPLYDTGESLEYKSIYFDGPDFADAKEQLEVKLMQTPQFVDYPHFLDKKQEGLLQAKGKYRGKWEISMAKPGIATDGYCFGGNRYFIKALNTEIIPVQVQNVYMDINSSWSRKEFESAYAACKSKNIWIYGGFDMIRLTPENKDDLFYDLHKLEFSLFPIHKIEESEHAMLISKGSTTSPDFSDMSETGFMQELKLKFATGGRIFFFNLGEELSPYLKTLLEYRILQYQHGNVEDIKKILQTNSFLGNTENDNRVIINQANICINKEEGECAGNAPDHITRLFSYNHIMQQYAKNWVSGGTDVPAILQEARQAYVVSPVSSLIVLETQDDYDRFDIKNIDNTLGNASYDEKTKKVPIEDFSAGEWIAFCLVIGFLFYFRRVGTKN